MIEQRETLKEERLEFLKRSTLGTALSETVLRVVAKAMEQVQCEKGQMLIQQGEAVDYFYILTSGKVGVDVHTEGGAVNTVATLNPGDCFGEMSLLTGDPASTDVVASESSEVLRLHRDGFNALVAADPIMLREFLRMLSHRLRNTDMEVGSAKEKERGLTRFLKEERAEQYGDMIGKHTAKALGQLIEEQAELDTPLLIQGERGTGKELLGRLIHFRSQQQDHPMFSTECDQISEITWGDKLFGDYHRKEAGRPHPNGYCYMDLAENSTLLLKNIDELPPAVQERLARYFEKDTGEHGSRRHNVRIIATCRYNLADMVAAGGISSELVTVLSEHIINVPSLRERKRDVPELANHFVIKHAQRLNKVVDGLDDQAVAKLVSYDYHIANVNELEEAIERAVILTDEEAITAEEIILGPPPNIQPRGFNLLNLPEALVQLGLRLFPRAIQGFAAVFFAFILYQCLFAPAPEGGNLGTILVWSLWWPVLCLSFFFAARMWCAICPMALTGKTAQRWFSLKRRIPGWLKANDRYIMMGGFFAIIWAEEVVGMRHDARATGILLLCIIAGAVLISILYPRKTWCRHFCPLGGFAGLCSSSSLLELRPTPDICAAQCRDHACYKGNDGTDGCPMFNHVMFVDSNQSCTFCMNCVVNCPHGSPQLNVRVPARELWTSISTRSDLGWFVVLLLGMLMSLTFIQYWEFNPGNTSLPRLLQAHRFVFVSAVLIFGTAIPLLGLWMATRHLGASPDPEAGPRFWQKIVSWAPLVAAGFVCYHLGYVPGLNNLQAMLSTESFPYPVAFSMLSVIRFGILSTGFIVAVAVLWKLRQMNADDEKESWMTHAVNLAGMITYCAVILVVMVGPEWLPG